MKKGKRKEGEKKVARRFLRRGSSGNYLWEVCESAGRNQGLNLSDSTGVYIYIWLFDINLTLGSEGLAHQMSQ